MTDDVTNSAQPDRAAVAPPAAHPLATVPDRLFVDDSAEKRWQQRFSATRMSLADPSRDNPDRAVYVSNATGKYELYCWDVVGGGQTIATDRPDGTVHGSLSADGESLFWFDDTDGDEFGQWRRQPFGAAPGSATQALPEVAPGYPAGLEVGQSLILAGFSDDDGSRVHLASSDEPATLLYHHENDAWAGPLSRDESIWILHHSEHGDSRYPALRALAIADGSVLGELDDSPGKGLNALEFSPIAGDQRVLVGHERQGRDELLIWNVQTKEITELAIDLPGDLSGSFFPDAKSLLLVHTHAARSTLHRYQLDNGELTDLPATRGSIEGALVRDDGSVWYRWSSAAEPAQLRQLGADGVDGTLLLPPGGAAPGSQPVHDVWTEGPGGTIHSLLAFPETAGAPAEPGLSNVSLPTVFYLHGGPAAADEDAYEGTRAAWLDAGFAVVQVNYRGSTGYGSTWRDALTARVGHTELADVAAVYDDLVVRGIVDPSRAVVAGASWGGFLTLLAMGTQPSRWAAGVAGVPVADYLQAYADEMDPLRLYDRALFGGSPEEKPDAYRDSSPLTYIDQVAAPVLILAGENDPRCPMKQIDNYLDALAAQDARYAVYKYEAGHGSMVVDERIRQVACEIHFAREVLSQLD